MRIGYKNMPKFWRSLKILGCIIGGLSLVACSKKERMKVGVVQTSNHEALDATRFGIMDELRSNNLTPEQDIDFKWESASGNPALATQIAQKFVGNQYDVIVGIGTMASQAALQAALQASGTPVVYASVTDPKGAKLNQGNVTGVSNYVEPDLQFKMFKRILPRMRRIGVIHNPGEQNSTALVQPMIHAGKDIGVEVVFASAPKTSDVYSAAMSLVGKVDALFVNNDNVGLAAFDSVLKVSREHKIPAFVSETSLVKKGAIAALGPNQHRVGIQAGRMIAELLGKEKDKRDASKIPPERVETPLLFLNQAAAVELNIAISDSVLRDATFV